MVFYHQYFTLISSAGTTTCPELVKTPESDWLLLARENPNVATVNQERYTDFCRVASSVFELNFRLLKRHGEKRLFSKP